jgi:hypothetical protein
MDVASLEPTAFGPGFEGHLGSVYANELKTMTPRERVRAFKARVDDYLIKQTDLLATKESWTPFPLTIMTCVGIELIGSYKYGDPGNNSNKHFQLFTHKIDRDFALEKPTPDGNALPLSDFLYSAFRNSFIHGYRGKWVFITHDPQEAEKWIYSLNEKYLVLNVYWLYKEFKRAYNEYFDHLLSATDMHTDPLLTFNKTFETHFSQWL